MLTLITKKIALYFIRKYAKDAVVEGAKALVASTKNTIDDEILDAFLGQAVKSKGNALNPMFKDGIMKSLTSGTSTKKAYL